MNEETRYVLSTIRCAATNYPLGEPPLLQCILPHGHGGKHLYEMSGIRLEMGSNDPAIKYSPAEEIAKNREIYFARIGI